MSFEQKKKLIEKLLTSRIFREVFLTLTELIGKITINKLI